MKLISLSLLFISLYICFILANILRVFVPIKKLTKDKKVLFLCPFFPGNAGYIYRAQKWAEILASEGYSVSIKTTLSKDQFNAYLENKDIRFYLIPLFKRFWHVLSSYNYNIVIVRREILLFNDYGNLFLEKFLLKIHPNTILDFDDDISYAKEEPREISFVGKLLLENGTKFKDSLLLYKWFIVASDYLKNYTLKHNSEISPDQICVIPTCVDYENFPQKDYSQLHLKKVISLGWIGSNGNLKLLENIIPELNEVHKVIPIKLIIISGQDITPQVDFEILNIRWSYETQIQDLLKIDLGLMPLNYTMEDKGKGGFKLIQYMGLGIVSIASAVTINEEIVTDNVEGFLVSPNGSWYHVILKALRSQQNFNKIGTAARRKINNNYSFISNKNKYLDFLSGK